MAKRNRKKKNDAADWMAGVQKRPSAFDHWRQLSWRLPLQPKRKRPMSAYADRNLGIFIVLAGILILIIISAEVFSIVVKETSAELSTLCIPLPLFGLVAIGLIKAGIDHIRYSAD